MLSPTITPGNSTGDLTSLSRAVNDLHRRCETSARYALDLAFQCGEKLLLAKSQTPHGEWMEWLTTNCPTVSIRVAQGYMRLATNREAIEHSNAKPDSYLTIKESLRLISTSKATEPESADSHSSPPSHPAYPVIQPEPSTGLDLPPSIPPEVEKPSIPEIVNVEAEAELDLDEVELALQAGKIWDEYARELRRVHSEYEAKISRSQGGGWHDDNKQQESKGKLASQIEVIHDTKPHTRCPYCNGQKCRICRYLGYVPRHIFRNAPQRGSVPAHLEKSTLK